MWATNGCASRRNCHVHTQKNAEGCKSLFRGLQEQCLPFRRYSIAGSAFASSHHERFHRFRYRPLSNGRAWTWDVLMKRLGYTRYVSEGGDHGFVISDALARQAPSGLLGIHLTMPATIPANLVKGINAGDPAPVELTAPELRAYSALSTFFGRNAAYGGMMATRPQTIGYSLADSPSGLVAWTYEKIAEWSGSDGHPENVIGRDEILDDMTLYWLTNTGASSSRFYWENNNNNFSAAAQMTNEIN